jgi:hypothetical protein
MFSELFFALNKSFRTCFPKILPNLHLEKFRKRVPNFWFKGKIGKQGGGEEFPGGGARIPIVNMYETLGL